MTCPYFIDSKTICFAVTEFCKDWKKEDESRIFFWHYKEGYCEEFHEACAVFKELKKRNEALNPSKRDEKE